VVTQTALIPPETGRDSSGPLIFARIHQDDGDRRYRSARLERTGPRRLFPYRTAVPVLALASRFARRHRAGVAPGCTAATARGCRGAASSGPRLVP
jgi:hypothetical protein